MFKIALFLGLGLTSWGSIIDSGTVFTPANFVSDATTVQFSLSSTDGNFSVFQLASGVPGGANLGCPLGVEICDYGQTYTIGALFPDASSGGVQAMAILNGVPAGTVLLVCPAADCPHTLVTLTAQPINISAPGDYVVPFSATGQIQAAHCVVLPCPLILDQTISGVGLLSFSVVTSSPGSFGVQNKTPGALKWVFEPVPEPSTILPVLFGLAAIQWRRHLRK
jgi:hypothetical protein